MANTNGGTGSRPTGITILAILEILGGVLSALSGIALIVIGDTILSSSIGAAAGVFGLLGSALVSGITLVLGLLYLAMGYGFLKGMAWSWWIAVILYVLGAISSLVGILTVIAIVPLAIYAFLLYYMTRPGVKRWFGV